MSGRSLPLPSLTCSRGPAAWWPSRRSPPPGTARGDGPGVIGGGGDAAAAIPVVSLEHPLPETIEGPRHDYYGA